MELRERVARAICRQVVKYMVRDDGLGEYVDAEWKYYTEEADAALSAIAEAHVIVPAEPTDEMLSAAFHNWIDGDSNDARPMYRAMLAARPK